MDRTWRGGCVSNVSPLNDSFNPTVFEEVGVCGKCVHKDDGKFTCKAFPDGIPPRISAGIVDHTEPVAGDNGIFFKKRV